MNYLDRLFTTGGNFIPSCEVRYEYYWVDEFQNLDAPRNVPAGSTIPVEYMNSIFRLSTAWLYIRIARN